MQRAARKVADENARLRSLLSSRGVAHEEIEAYLRSFDAASTPNHSSANRYALPVSRPPVLAIPAASSFGYMASPVSQARAPTPTQLPVQAPAQAVFQQPAHSPPHPSALAYTQSQDPRRSFVSTIQHAACDSEKENLATVTTPAVNQLSLRHLTILERRMTQCSIMSPPRHLVERSMPTVPTLPVASALPLLHLNNSPLIPVC